jgi:hypothetical protein
MAFESKVNRVWNLMKVKSLYLSFLLGYMEVFSNQRYFPGFTFDSKPIFV